ncbi:(Fe-S)-binding protein [Pyrobaculum calidifontis]|uniref:4Fe-4S ferredoxin-type domain-containing protein n=1 Tax=Pyrobaculum calidifontis (strain DSM 21063 / JCM 11548 / VA1) TaxID=410359 RepID=A3MVH9_PYRCJ|nr:(Fe-S)-binding protein [Pyrobaculum calidifontis]ABO08646.1 protein of unknown function DUF224, cysteine-rich region domain protein [Pyrobaculum calidifontis JCM 11548]
MTAAYDEVYKCVHCGFCLPTCPTYLATGVEGMSPRGRLYLIRAVLEGRARPTKDLLEYLDACVYCLRCETACPSGVKYGAVYEQFFKEHRKELQSITYSRYLPLFNALNTGPGLALARVGGSLVKELGALVAGRDVRMYVGKEFKAKGERVGRVALFVAPDCVAWRYKGKMVEAAIRVLTWNGYDVVVPRFRCCGAPYRHSGQFEKSEELAKYNKAVVGQLGRIDYVVVANSGGCQAELMRYFDNVVDVFQLLAKNGVRERLGPVKLRLALQHSCHLMNVAKAHTHIVALLSKVPELKVVPLPSADVCCGGGALYPMRHRDIANKILEVKRREVFEIKPDGILVESPACLQQLSKLGVPVYTPIEILDLSYKNANNLKYLDLEIG